MSVHGEINKDVVLCVGLDASYIGNATIGYKLFNSDKTQYAALTTTGVTETPASSASFVVKPPQWSAAFVGYVQWYAGSTPLAGANEDIIITDTLATIAGYIDTEVAAIKAKTDNLPSDPADASDIAASFSSIASTLATIGAYVDTEVAAIKAKTDNLPSDPADQSLIIAATDALAAAVAALGTPAQDSALATLQTAVDALGAPLQTDDSRLDNLDATISSRATQTSVDTVSGYVDTEVATIRNSE